MEDSRDTKLLAVIAPYEWVRWLSPPDATVLLMYLCKCIEQPGIEIATLVSTVEGLRTNALRALETNDWTANIDGYLELRVDARAWLASQGRL